MWSQYIIITEVNFQHQCFQLATIWAFNK